jgi:pyruvate kinase
MHVVANGGEPDLAAIFDLANVAFDHIDCVVLTEVPGQPAQVMRFLAAAAEILVVAESYLEITDRPVRVGFGQPPHTAALAYAIRHILKLQEIAAVAIYSLTGQTARVISKNWIACPVLAFSSRPATARKMCLYHGVTSRHVEAQLNPASLLDTAGILAKDLEIAVPGDLMIVVSGHPDQTQDQANGFVVETIS